MLLPIKMSQIFEAQKCSPHAKTMVENCLIFSARLKFGPDGNDIKSTTH